MKSGNEGLTVWFTGLSGSGKTTICLEVQKRLSDCGILSIHLDGDELRKTLNRHLGFTKEDRDENIRRIGMVASILTRQGAVVLVSAISPYRAVRDEVRETILNFIEVFVDTPLDVCEQRDPKGLYKRARSGEIKGFTGIDDPYEPPFNPELRIDTSAAGINFCRDKVFNAVMGTLERFALQRA